MKVYLLHSIIICSLCLGQGVGGGVNLNAEELLDTIYYCRFSLSRH